VSSEEVPISYADFYDVPRAWLMTWEGETLFFDCPFDEALDDYPDEYVVYRLFREVPRDSVMLDWSSLRLHGVELGAVAVASVRFDATRRRSVIVSSVESILKAKAALP
jgi:hypothetical protein